MHRGYTKRWRKRWDRGYHKDAILWLLMDYFIDFANYTDSQVFFPGAGVIRLKRGQHIFGSRQLAVFLGVDRNRIRRKLKILESIGFLTLKATQRYSIATIINYDTYNPMSKFSDPPTDPLKDPNPTLTRPASDPQATTPNKDKEDNENNKGNVYEDFQRFWLAYPRKNRKSDAWQSWQRLNRSGCLPPIGDLLKAIVEQKKSDDWLKESGKYIPNPSTWLNGGCWLNEINNENNPRWLS